LRLDDGRWLEVAARPRFDSKRVQLAALEDFFSGPETLRVRLVADILVQSLERRDHETGEAEPRRFADLRRAAPVGRADSPATNRGAPNAVAPFATSGRTPRGAFAAATRRRPMGVDRLRVGLVAGYSVR